jgi:Tfp pilus assembly protein PilN
MAAVQRSAFLKVISVEISSAVPAWLKTMFLGQPTARPLYFKRGLDSLETSRGDIQAPFALLKGDVVGLQPVPRKNVDIYLPETVLLKRDITVPTASLAKIDSIVALDTVQKTPFKPHEIFSTIKIVERSKTGAKVVQWIARKDTIDAIVAQLKALGLSVRQIHVEEQQTSALADFSSEIAPRAKSIRRLNGLVVFVGGLLLAGWAIAPTWFAAQALEKQASYTSALSERAVALRNELEDLQGGATEHAAFIARVSRRQTVSHILRELTVALPDTVWLTDVSIQNGRIIVRGSTSGSAAELVLSLTEDRRFISPRLTGPVSQTADRRERFDMTFDFRKTGS